MTETAQVNGKLREMLKDAIAEEVDKSIEEAVDDICGVFGLVALEDVSETMLWDDEFFAAIWAETDKRHIFARTWLCYLMAAALRAGAVRAAPMLFIDGEPVKTYLETSPEGPETDESGVYLPVGVTRANGKDFRLAYSLEMVLPE